MQTLKQIDETQHMDTDLSQVKLLSSKANTDRPFDKDLLHNTIIKEDFEDDIFDDNWMYATLSGIHVTTSYELPKGASMPWEVIAEENNSVGYCNMLGAYAYIDMTGYEKVYIRFRYKVGQATKFEPIPTWHEEEIYIQYDLSERFTTHVYQGTSQWDEEKYPSKFSVLKVVWGKGDERFGVILKDFNDIYIDDFEVYGTKRGESSELRATIEAPEILALTPTKEVYNPNPFEIKFNIENLKNSAVKNVKAVLSLPEGVTLVEGNNEML